MRLTDRVAANRLARFLDVQSRRPRPPPPSEPVRLAKALADAGVASRRAAEGLIAEGRVKVNGSVQMSPAINVTLGKDTIEARPTTVAGSLSR